MFARLKITVLIILTPALVFAGPKCVEYEFLKNGFDMNAFKTCEVELKKCPQEHGLPDMACINKTVSETSECKQLSQLATKTHGIMGMIDAETVADNFAVITQHYPADGQENYYIVSPAGCLVKTTIDPRTVDAKLKKDYKKTDFFIRAGGKPELDSTVADITRFVVPLTVTKSCAACEVIGKAKVDFDFSKEGSLLKSTLVSFDTGNKEKN